MLAHVLSYINGIAADHHYASAGLRLYILLELFIIPNVAGPALTFHPT